MTHSLQQRRFRRIGASAVRATKKSSITANRKSTMRFSTSYKWSPYVTSNSPKGWLKKRICRLKTDSYISIIAEASDFKFGRQLGFAKAHHKITPIGKSGYGLGLGEIPKILWFHFNIYTMAEARDFKFGIQLRFAKAQYKNHTQRKSGRGLGLWKFPYIWRCPLIFSATAALCS